MIPFIGDKVVERGQQERTKPTLFPIGFLNRTPLQKLSEESLGQILGVMLSITATAQIRVKWIPINTAEPVQRHAGAWPIGLTGRQDDAPMGRGEHRAAGWLEIGHTERRSFADPPVHARSEKEPGTEDNNDFAG